jgi:hypothetical protein
MDSPVNCLSHHLHLFDIPKTKIYRLIVGSLFNLAVICGLFEWCYLDAQLIIVGPKHFLQTVLNLFEELRFVYI